MCGLKLVVIAFVIQNGHLISIAPTKDNTAEILWNLSQMAIQNKQLENPGRVPSDFQLNPEKFSKYVGPIKSNSLKKIKQDEISPKLMNYNYNNIPQRRPGYPSNIPNYPPNIPNYPSNIPNYPSNIPNYPSNIPNYPSNIPNYPSNIPNYPSNIPNYPSSFPNYHTNYPQSEQSFMGALNTIARNDRLQCVPRLLCELTSGPSGSENQRSSILPFNINMESIVGLVSALGGTQSSPLLQFGKAALLGYSAKGNTRSCMYAFPECPQDPDKLIEYLNNYNGGFFRYFNGVQRPQSIPSNPNLNYYHHRPVYPQQPQNYPLNYNPNFVDPYQYPQKYYPQVNQQYGYYNPVPNVQRPYQHSVRFDNNNQYAQKRIQTKPNSEDDSFYSTNKYQFKFPNHFENLDNEETNFGHSFRFPNSLNLYNEQLNNYVEPYPKDVYSENSIFKFKPSPMIFPDRTGTGELRLDPDEFYKNGISKKWPREYRDQFVHFYDKTANFRFPSVNQEY